MVLVSTLGRSTFSVDWKNVISHVSIKNNKVHFKDVYTAENLF